MEVYDFNARTYDQQIGRFIQIDPLVEFGSQESLTPYQFSFNNPIRYNDPDGKCPLCPAIPWVAEAIYAGGVAVFSYFTAKAASPIIIQASQDLGKSFSNAPSVGADANAFIPLSAQVAQARLNNGAVPNPNGKKGGEAHQKTIDKEEQRLKD